MAFQPISAVSRLVPESITLVVDNTRFVVDREMFRAHPDTMLGR